MHSEPKLDTAPDPSFLHGVVVALAVIVIVCGIREFVRFVCHHCDI